VEIEEIVLEGIQRKASDIHITVGIPPAFRIDGELVSFGNKKLYPEDTEYLVKQTMNELQFEKFIEAGEYDFSFSIQGISRFRVNAYKQRGSFGMALRIIPYDIPTMQFLGLPSVIEELTELNRGLILVTGPTGSGKSTTLATMIDKINSNRRCHIITLEDPIEYLHKHDKSIINQREIGTDTKSFANALRGALREDPDVILVGEMRDLDTISIAITAAETGHLVLSTLHTIGAPQTIDRIIDVFPPYQQQQVRIQLSSVIQAIITQQLLPKADGNGRIAAFEVMIATPAIRNLIRESKVHQIETAMLTGTKNKMQTMDNSLLQLYKTGKITKDMAISRAISQEEIKKYL